MSNEIASILKTWNRSSDYAKKVGRTRLEVLASEGSAQAKWALTKIR